MQGCGHGIGNFVWVGISFIREDEDGNVVWRGLGLASDVVEALRGWIKGMWEDWVGGMAWRYVGGLDEMAMNCGVGTRGLWIQGRGGSSSRMGKGCVLECQNDFFDARN